MGFSTTASPNSLASLAGVKPTFVEGTASQAGTASAGFSITQGVAILGQSVIQAGVQSTIQGGSFLDALKASGVSNLSAALAYQIGDLGTKSLGELGYVGAHAVLGCASSAALGTGCAGGAIGGAVSAALTPFLVNALISEGRGLNAAQISLFGAIASLAGGGVAGLAGQNAAAGALSAQNEAINNCLGHPESCSDLASKIIAGWRAPDYVSITAPTPIPFVGVTATLDRYGEIYGGPSVGFGLPNVSGKAWAIGWTGDQTVPDAAALKDWLSGWSYNAGVFIGTTVSSPASPGSDSPSRLGGTVQTPGVGVGYSWPLIQLGIQW
nr:DUF637 domain-containing protein [Pandoraea sputorum]